MAIRVRKLAKELDTTAEALLSLLQDMGHQRYRTADDMVADPVAARVRKEAKRRPLGPRPPAPRRRPEPPRGSGRGADLMAQLVPGVVRGARGASPPEAPLVVAAPGPVAVPSLEELAGVADRDALEAALIAERAELERVRGALEQSRAEVESLREELAIRLAEVEAERTALGSVRAELEARAQPREDSVIALLEARGLRGRDEAERAIGALAGARALGELLDGWRVMDFEAGRVQLAERLLLVGGDVPEALRRVPVVTVAPDRAEVPAATELAAALARVGEELMLTGLRRVVLIGGRPLWQRVVRGGLDPRIELSFRPGAPASADDVAADALVAWGVALAPALVSALRERGVTVVQLPDSSLAAMLDGLPAALAAG